MLISNRVCVPNKTEDLNLSLFNMIKEMNESKTVTKHILCKHECKFDIIKSNSNQKWNNDKCQGKCLNPKSIIPAKKIILESCYM